MNRTGPTLDELLHGSRDVLYLLLGNFVEATGRQIPTVNMSEQDLDALRALLLRWRDGENVEVEILEGFAIPPGALS
jgi:hypothetical protein